MEIERSEFGKLIDGSAEDFRKHCDDKNLGYVVSLRNYIAGVYQTFVKMKDELKDKIQAESLPQSSAEWGVFQGMFIELMKLEEKACICTEIINERKLNN